MSLLHPPRRPLAAATALDAPRRLCAAALLVVAALLAAPTAAQAAFKVSVTSAAPADRTASKFTNFTVATAFPGTSSPRSLEVDLPGGQLGVLQAVDICSAALLAADRCPSTTQLGTAQIAVGISGLGTIDAAGSIYRVATKGNEVARIAILARPPIGDKLVTEGVMWIRDDGSYGVRAIVPEIPKTAVINLAPLGQATLPITVESMRMVLFGRVGGNKGPGGLFFNRAHCTEATTVVRATAWDGSKSEGTAGYTPTGCDDVPFAPTVSFLPEHAPADTPVEFGVVVEHPFEPSADKMFPPYEETRLRLPDGVSLASAVNSDGKLVACAAEQLNIHRNTPASCRAESQVGRVDVVSPLLGTIPGKVFIGLPSGTRAHEILQLFIVAELGSDVDSLRVKLAAQVSVDSVTRVMTAVLPNLPDQPVQRFDFRYRGGSAPGARQPEHCGVYPGGAVSIPRTSGPPKTITGNYVVDTNCEPTAGDVALSYASTELGAGRAATGEVTLTLPQHADAPRTLRASLPQGLVGMLASVPACTNARAAASACPAESRLGSAAGLSGQGPAPGYFPGDLYLTEPPKPGDVAGLLVVVPAAVGPFSLGNLVVHASLQLRPDFGVDLLAELPDAAAGVPLDQRALTLRIDRPSFLRNPTNCAPAQLAAVVTDLAGVTRKATTPFTPTGCDQLSFGAKLQVAATGGVKELAKDGSPGLDIRLQPSGDGRLSRIQVRFPKAIAADLRGLQATTCPSLESAKDGSCTAPPVGTAETSTPLFATPLRGTLHAVRLPDETLPALLIRVRDRVSLDLLARVRTNEGPLVATVDGVPDVPIDDVQMQLGGGDRGIIRLVAPLCGEEPLQATGTATSHHGASAALTAPLTAPCGLAAGKPKITATGKLAVRGRGSTRGLTLAIKTSHAANTVVLTLPPGTRLDRATLRKLTVRTARGKVKPRSVSVKGRRVTLKLRAVTRRITVTAPVGSAWLNRTLQRQLASRSKRAKLRAPLTVSGPSGKAAVNASFALPRRK